MRYKFKRPPDWMYPKQREAVFHEERFGIVEASTKAGKTISHIDWLIGEALRSPGEGHTVYWIAPVYRQAKIAYERAPLMYRDPDFIREKNKQDLTFVLPNGCKFACRSAENPDNLYADDVWAVVMDEASRMQNGDEVWKAVVSVTTATAGMGGGRVRIIGNVVGRRTWAYQQARKAEAGARDWHYAELTADDAVDAGVLDRRVIEQAREELPFAEFRQLYFNEPLDDGSNPFGYDAIEDCTMPEDWAGDGPVMSWGVDVARKRDWTVGIGLNDAGEVAGFFETQDDWEVQKELIRDELDGGGGLMDATSLGDTMLEALQHMGVAVEGYVFSAPSKTNLIRRLIIAIRDRRIRFPAGRISRELMAFEMQVTDSGRITYGAPPYEHDDAVMALALAVEDWEQGLSKPWGIITSQELERYRREREAVA